MATVRWLGTATAVNQISTATPANVEIGDVFNLLVGGVTIATFTASAATVANVTAGLTAAWNASSHPYATGITASDQATLVRLTADSAGVPFTVTSSTTDGGGANTQTLTMATTTANAGPNVWTTATNWSGGSVPTNSDIVIFENNAVPVFFGLDQSGVTLTELRILQSYTGQIGLPETKFLTTLTGNFANYDTSKTEYRDTYLKVGASALNIGQSVGYLPQAGATRIKVNLGSVEAVVSVYDSCISSADEPLQPVRLLGTHAGNDLTVYKGTVGVATSTGSEVSTFANTQQAGGNLTFGKGVTWTTISKTGGTASINSVGTTLVNSGGDVSYNAASGTATKIVNKDGTANLSGAFAITELDAFGGTTTLDLGTVITNVVIDGGTLDCSASSQSPTFSDCEIRPGGGQLVLNRGVTLSTGISYDLTGSSGGLAGSYARMKAVFTST